MLIPKLLVAVGVLTLSSACKTQDFDRDSAIEVEGIVEVYPGGNGAGTIRTDAGKCYDLALPKEVLRKSRQWEQKSVAITGYVVVRPRLADAVWFDIKDRRIEAGGCSDEVIYVKSIARIPRKT